MEEKILSSFISQISEEIKGFCKGLNLERITFEEIEELHRTFMIGSGRKIIQFNLERLAERRRYGYQGSQIEVKGREALFKRHEERKINTYFGEVSLKRAYYWFPESGEPQGFSPLDMELGLRERRCSPSLERGIALIGIEAPFAKASQILKEISLVEICSKTIEEFTQEKGEEVRELKLKEAEKAWEIFDGPSKAAVERGKTKEKKAFSSPYYSSSPERLYMAGQ